VRALQLPHVSVAVRVYELGGTGDKTHRINAVLRGKSSRAMPWRGQRHPSEGGTRDAFQRVARLFSLVSAFLVFILWILDAPT
jgi:hypothetical protein